VTDFDNVKFNNNSIDLQDIASLLNLHPNTISKIRRDITFDGASHAELYD
jgi:hypothetical protein